MQVLVLDTEKTLYQGYAKKVTLPALEEEMCILDFHQPFLVALRGGLVKIAQEMVDITTTEHSLAIKKGIAKMVRNELTLMVEV